MRVSRLLCCCIILVFHSSAAALDLGAANQVILIRHALAPGTGDPAQLDLEDCRTQRNLNEVGRQQSRELGALFREQGIPQARLYSSQWCRCVETAELMDLGPVNVLKTLNSFFRNRSEGPAQIEALQAWLLEQDLSQTAPVILVTHQVVITGLLGQLGESFFPASGEIVVLRRNEAGQFRFAGSLETL